MDLVAQENKEDIFPFYKCKHCGCIHNTKPEVCEGCSCKKFTALDELKPKHIANLIRDYEWRGDNIESQDSVDLGELERYIERFIGVDICLQMDEAFEIVEKENVGCRRNLFFYTD